MIVSLFERNGWCAFCNSTAKARDAGEKNLHIASFNRNRISEVAENLK